MSAAALGIRHIRLTGGEPLVRRGCVDLVEKIKNVSGIETVGMTTNGVLLAEYAKALKEAGLDSVNVSLDTLDETEFQRLTGRDELNAVLAGINAAKEAQIPVKINTVHYQHLDWKSILDYTNRVQIPVRFIEAGKAKNIVQISGICRTRKRSSNPENMAQVLQLTTVFRD